MKKNTVAQTFGFFLTVMFFASFFSCKQEQKASNDVSKVIWEPYNDSIELAENAAHENGRMQFKLIQSKVLDKNKAFMALYEPVSQFSESRYQALKPLILEQSIPAIQGHIKSGEFTYEELTLFYLKRIYTYELNNETSLHTIIALNRKVLEEARGLTYAEENHPIYGMPVLLKDNIGSNGMATTAGSIALQDHMADDAFIVERLRENGALILGKVNLSEWAYYLCTGCPLGYSAVGGQTLNPYGRRVFETGGSSAGSGTSVAANYAVAAVGTETSGSILSPSSQNSVVGLKPTIGLLSRSGIVPISSTLDTPGPMTKKVVDNRILLSAMLGKDAEDAASVAPKIDLLQHTVPTPFNELKFGVFEQLMESDSIYAATVNKLEAAGATIVAFSPPEVAMEGFLSILNIDMRNDLPQYLSTQVKDKESVKIASIADAVAFNKKDTLTRIPYGQALFEGILKDSTTAEGLLEVKNTLEANGRKYFNTAMDANGLDAILSINNYHAGFAAVAKFPALTVPMGYKTSGEPISLTFIGKQFTESNLLQMGEAFEQLTQIRKIPNEYAD